MQVVQKVGIYLAFDTRRTPQRPPGFLIGISAIPTYRYSIIDSPEKIPSVSDSSWSSMPYWHIR